MAIEGDQIYVRKYLAGSDEALEFLISKYMEPLYRYAYAHTASAADAQDIVQETFVKMWKHIGTYDTGMEFKPWIFRIARNTIIDWARRKKTVPFSVLEKESDMSAEELFADAGLLPSDLTELKLQTAAIDRALEGIPPIQRTFFDLKEEGLTFKNIAQRTGIPLNTVKSAYRRTIIKLRRLLS